jgi:hypothetical protein
VEIFCYRKKKAKKA